MRQPLGHENLDLYRVSRQFAVDLYRETAGFPADERYGLTSQIRRAAVSIPANIAEGAARRSKKEFTRFLLMARGSSAELRVLLEIAWNTGILSEARFRAHEESVDRISSMASGLIRQSDSQTDF
jgi:four helix bundle protein